jgi:hypothetical protein
MGGNMTCRTNVARISDICTELLELIDESRAGCDANECELVHCVVHDSVVKIRRVITQWSTAVADEDHTDRLERTQSDRPTVM